MTRYRTMGVLAVVLMTWIPPGSPVGAFAQTRYSIPLEGSPSIGPPDAPVVLVEFLDYQ